MKASEFLAMAHDEIDKGWTQGKVQDQAGNVCAVGAMRRVAEQQMGQGLDGFIDVCSAGSAAAGSLAGVAMELTDNRFVGIPGFNDTREDKQEVLNWFFKALAQLEERGE